MARCGNFIQTSPRLLPNCRTLFPESYVLVSIPFLNRFFITSLSEHKPPTTKFHGFRVSKFKHLSGKPSKKSFNIENIKNFDQSLSHESDGLQAYNDLVAYPVAGPGGQIAVVKVKIPAISVNLTKTFNFQLV